MVRICFCVFDLFKAGSKTLQVLTLELCARAMLEFSASVWEYQALSDSNVIAVHCKGGKGRTGTMVCACLIDSGAFRCVCLIDSGALRCVTGTLQPCRKFSLLFGLSFLVEYV